MDPFFAFIMLVSSIVHFDKMNTLKTENAVLEQKVNTLKYATEDLYVKYENDFIRLSAVSAAATARRAHDIDVNKEDIDGNKIEIELLHNQVEYLMER
jgi:hypothetical protein